MKASLRGWLCFTLVGALLPLVSCAPAGKDAPAAKDAPAKNEPAEDAAATSSAAAAKDAKPAAGQTADDQTEKLLAAASSGDAQARYAAIDDLGESHDSAAVAVPKLILLLKDPDPKVCWRTARTLGDYGPEAASAAGDLRALLTNADPIIQYHAAVALGEIGDRSDETFDALAAAVKNSKDDRVTRAAIAALGRLQPDPDSVLDSLAVALESDDPAVVAIVLESIASHGGHAAELLNRALDNPDTAYLACTVIERIGPDAASTAPSLAKLLGETKHSKLQIQALLAVGSLGPGSKAAEPAVLALLESSDDATVPVAAAYALGAIEAEEADAQLEAALDSENKFLKMMAAWSLAKIHPDDQQAMQRAVKALTAGLTSEDVTLRNAAAKSLQSLGAPAEDVAPALIALAGDKDPEVLANVVDALASLGESIVPRASTALERPEMRSLAVMVLTQLGPKASGAVPALVKALADSNAATKAQIHLALAEIGPAAAPATEALAKSVADKDEFVRRSAIFALRKIGPAAKAAQPALTAGLGNKDPFDAAAAAWALAAISPGDAQVAEKGVPHLIAGLKSENELARLECAEALGVWAKYAKAAVPTLKELAAGDDSYAVRGAAASTLERIGA
ncbi:HEAT repeat protein [Pirellulimonas nuda]|uniref:HEAT repeat protein n=1 Tax=Pirellulimonas nuda TaxID=2528009 RepID=A0A518D966_9BACT|nr:HEAT repeat domain-containing protein [Pirellulimonas nuda]QDU88012.1 HEAT repeat protein [Pirellulimonas nuda]